MDSSTNIFKCGVSPEIVGSIRRLLSESHTLSRAAENHHIADRRSGTVWSTVALRADSRCDHHRVAYVCVCCVVACLIVGLRCAEMATIVSCAA